MEAGEALRCPDRLEKGVEGKIAKDEAMGFGLSSLKGAGEKLRIRVQTSQQGYVQEGGDLGLEFRGGSRRCESGSGQHGDSN